MGVCTSDVIVAKFVSEVIFQIVGNKNIRLFDRYYIMLICYYQGSAAKEKQII